MESPIVNVNHRDLLCPPCEEKESFPLFLNVMKPYGTLSYLAGEIVFPSKKYHKVDPEDITPEIQKPGVPVG